MLNQVKLKIAETVILICSDFEHEKLSAKEKKDLRFDRFVNFFYRGSQKPDIIVKVIIAEDLPQVKSAKSIFVTYHPDDNSENWRLLKKCDSYIFKTPLNDKEQLMFINRRFNRVTAYLLPKDKKGKVWNFVDILYDFLQVLLINYFALNKNGIFIHSFGVKDISGSGLIFAGKSRCGKSTSARIWRKYSKAMLLNDDRIILRKIKNHFQIYGSPWHGDFSDYLTTRMESAPVKSIFFIHHYRKNRFKIIPPKKAFFKLYPAIFPTFWDKHCLENIVSFCQDFLNSVTSINFGFKNNRKIIGFVRKICAEPSIKTSVSRPIR